MRYLFYLAAFLLFSVAVQAQIICHVASDSIIPKMPSYIKAQSEAAAYGQIIQKQIEGKQAEIQAFVADIERKYVDLSPKQVQDARDKLGKMQEDYEKFLSEQENKMMEREEELKRPVIEEFNKALREVCKENGYAYAIDMAYIIYSEGGISVTDKVRAKLGITP